MGKTIDTLKVLIIGGAFTPNKGAGAMSYVAIDIAKELAEKSDLKSEILFMTDFISLDRDFINDKDVTLIDERHGLTPKPIINKVLEFGLSFFGIITPLRGLIAKFYNLKHYYNSDIVLDVSGDACGDGYKKGVAVVLRRIAIAKNLGTKVIILPQSLGPFTRGSSKLLVGSYFPRLEKIFYRESVTKGILEGMNLTNAEYSPDIAFHLKPTQSSLLSKYVQKTEKPLVGLSVSNSISRYADEPEKLDNYIRIFKQFIEKYSPSYDFVFINHVLGPGEKNDDRLMSQKILDVLEGVKGGNVVNIVDDLSAQQLKELIGGTDLFIGSRMHSNIAALSRGVPPIAISYSHKFRGIMMLFGLNEYVIEFADLSFTNLEETFLKMVENQESIRKQVKTTNTEIADQYEVLVKSIHEAIS